MNDLESGEEDSFNEPVHLKKGQVLFAQGEGSSYLYIVVKGEIGIFLEENEKLIFLNTVGDKDFIGELSMFSNDTRNATAIALNDSSLMVIKKTDIQKVLKTCPDWITNIMLTLTDRLRNTVDVLREHRVVDEIHHASTKMISSEEMTGFHTIVNEYKERRGI